MEKLSKIKSKANYFLLIACLLVMSETVFAQIQEITFSNVALTVQKAFLEVEQQTNLSIAYNEQVLNKNREIVLAKQTYGNLDNALSAILKGTDTDYKVQNGQIIIVQQAANDKFLLKGRVVDASNSEPIIGATVIVETATGGYGEVTNVEGDFAINVHRGDAITVSYIGYTDFKQIVQQDGFLNIALTPSSIDIGNVVVTALGIKKEEKSLTYNLQKVSGDVVNKVKSSNFMNSLSGKVAGLQINASASGAGGSTRVVMRGVKSINGDNNALYVVDGIPIPSLRSQQTQGTYETPDGGDFEGITNFNPEDIESMSILTGATASALYGSQGANGVILITTKKGRSGEMKINYSNSTTFDSPFVMPDFQNRYGTNDNEPLMSWGNKLETPTDYNPTDFFQTGFNENNSLSLSVGTDRNQTYVSVSALNARGIVPNNAYSRYNFSVRNTAELIKDKLTLDAGMSYIRQYNRNQTIQGQYHNPLIGAYLFPRGNDISKYQIYERPGVNGMEQFWGLEFLNGVENPWWIANRQLYENNTNRFMFNATLTYDVTDWLTLSGRARTDNTTMNYTRKLYASTNTLFASEFGNYLNHTMVHNNFYGDVLMSINKNFFDNDLSFQFNFGASIMDDKHQLTGYEGYLAAIPNKFTYNNIMQNSQSFAKQENYHDQTQAIYGTVQLGYKGMLYLDVTARNEWASMLAFTDQLNIFYPSVGLSAVVSAMTDLSPVGVSFLKVRTSYAEVGNAPPRFITGPNYPISGGIIGSASIAPASHLEAERTKSFEVGMDVKFLGSKIWLDATYYNTNTYNQLFSYDAPPSSGYKQKYINAGKVNNYGLEAVVGYKNTWSDFAWTTSYNFSLNRNEIKELVPEGTLDVDTGAEIDIPEINKDFGGYRVKLAKGGSIGDFYVKGLLTDDQGRIYVDPNSNTVMLDPDPEAWIYAGNTNARFRMGWNNQFSYKGINLGVLIDARIGGQGVSATQALMDEFGVSQASVDARENGGVWISDTQLIPDAKTFYSNSGDGMAMLSHYVYDMTNVRLRELTVGYDLPSKWFKNKVNMSVSFVGTNLFMFYNKAPFDPEITASTSTYYQGVDFFMQPSVRTLGFSVRLQF